MLVVLAPKKENIKNNQLIFEKKKKEEKYLRGLAIPDIKYTTKLCHLKVCDIISREIYH